MKYLWTVLSDFQGKISNTISLNYDFQKKYTGLSKQRLTLNNKNEDNPLLKFHRLTISIKNTKSEFDSQLKESLSNYINSKFSNSDNYDELEDILEYLYADRDKLDLDWYALKRLMDTKAIAKVQRTAKIKYLEYLLEHIGEDNNAIHLEILIKRLQALESYINDPDKSDGDYQVSYASESCNLREIFSRAEAFDSLPIIPLIDGGLGEIRDDNKGELNFIFGLKLKLGGKVQTEGGTIVLEYNLDLINPDSEQHKEGLDNKSKKKFFVQKIIQRVVLYFFVFAGINPQDENYDINKDLDYDVINKFEQDILPKLKKSDDNGDRVKRDSFKDLIQGIQQYNVEAKIDQLKNLLKTKIKTFRLWQSRIYPIQINIKQGVLETDANTIDDCNTLFREVLNQKAALKYLSVSDSNIDTSSLCHLSGDIRIDEIGYFNTTDHQKFTMEYLKGKFPTIPVVTYPRHQKCINILEKNFKK